jgi:hypothetical protein
MIWNSAFWDELLEHSSHWKVGKLCFPEEQIVEHKLWKGQNRLS